MSARAARGVVVWLTGLPSSGKSTLARGVAERERARDEPVLLLDGDEVRDAIVPGHGYDDASREAFYETLARLASLGASQGLVVIVAATAHRRAHRARARALAPAFVEVFVDVPLVECERRDAKGLYAAARAAGGGTMPGLGAAYEIPERPEVRVAAGDPDPVPAIVGALRAARGPD